MLKHRSQLASVLHNVKLQQRSWNCKLGYYTYFYVMSWVKKWWSWGINNRCCYIQMSLASTQLKPCQVAFFALQETWSSSTSCTI